MDGAGLLVEIEAAISAHAVLPEGAAVAMALWILHSYSLDAAAITPRLAIVSPTKRCGKTTVLKLLGALACKPLAAASLTPAVLYRVIEAYAPTILVDEADTFLADQDELRGVLNAGHDRHSAVVPRCVGDDFEPKVFHVFGAVAIAAIGKLPDTLMDRSIVIEMKRKAPTEKLQKLRRRQREALAALPRQCARWAADNMKALSEREPELPEDLDDRAADNWEPLLAIADQAGGPWPERARAIALLLSGGRADAAETGDSGVQLLADVRTVFVNNGIDRSTTKALLASLAELEGRPWAEWNRGRPLTARQLGSLAPAVRNQARHDSRRRRDPQGVRAGRPRRCVRALPPRRFRHIRHNLETARQTRSSSIRHSPRPATDHENGRNRLDFADVADVAARSPEREPGCDDHVPF